MHQGQSRGQPLRATFTRSRRQQPGPLRLRNVGRYMPVGLWSAQPQRCVCGSWRMKQLFTRAATSQKQEKGRKTKSDRQEERCETGGIDCSGQALTVEILRVFLLLLQRQRLTSCDRQQYLAALSPVPAGPWCPALNVLSQSANRRRSASPTCCSGHPQSPAPWEQTGRAGGSLAGWEQAGSRQWPRPPHQAWGAG